MKAFIENIQHYCLHDGPGTRTTIFFKGCPLRCVWCSNPTTQDYSRDILIKPDQCLQCYTCVNVCHVKAINITALQDPIIDRTRCTRCGACATSCAGKALLVAGVEYELEDVFSIIKKDMLFYLNSGGGVTFSGGEVLGQYQFVAELAARCRAIGIHTAMETSGFGAYSSLQRLAEQMDYIFYDIKHLDSATHVSLTGQPNECILANLKQLGKDFGNSLTLHVRFPLIPGLNDAPEHLQQLGRFVATVEGVRELEVLPYHRLGKNKYDMLGCEYALGDMPPASQDVVADAVQRVRECALGIPVRCFA